MADSSELIGHYSGLAREAAAGGSPVDTPGGRPLPGCGVSAYAGAVDAAEPALAGSLACGNPTAAADLRSGQVVLDLGSGGGLDVVLAARQVGPGGRVFGLDASPDMLRLAAGHAARAGVSNAGFLHGRVEAIPLADGAVDVVISNCVLALADRDRALAEAARVLRPGGRLAVTDLVTGPAGAPTFRCGGTELPAPPTPQEYRDALLAAGFAPAAVTPTHAIGEGMLSALVTGTVPEAPAGLRIRPMADPDADAVLAIYQTGLDSGDASFAASTGGWADFTASRLPLHRYSAAETAGVVLGWVAASGVSDRCVYAGVVEHSVYVHPGARGRGIGRALLAALLASTESAGIWTVQAGIFPENEASLALHTALGFRVVGTRERLGRDPRTGRWRDVVLLERRSATAGHDQN